MSQLEVDKIIPQSGTTLTIGDSGDTVNFADGTALSIDTNTLYIDSANNRVGIGTTSPGRKLTLYDDTDSYFALQNSTSGTGTSDGFQLQIFSDDAYVWNYESAGNMHFGTSGEFRQTIASNGDISFYEDTGTTPKFYWDASTERLGIGTTTPSTALHIDANVPNIRLTDDAVSTSANARIDLYGSDARSGYVGMSSGNLEIWHQQAKNIRFATSNTEAMRIDSSGNLLVGKTNNALSNDGIVIREGGEILATNTSDLTANFNRLSTDGDIVSFYKDGTTIGKIGVDLTDNLFISGNSSHAGWMFSSSTVLPYKNGALADNTLDIGATNARVKDIYLGGGLYVGGTGTANKLDDYEEGTWTPTVDSGGITITTINNANYVKVGGKVTATCYLSIQGGDTSLLQIGGLPFTVGSSNYAVNIADFGKGGFKGAYGRASENATNLQFFVSSENTSTNRTQLVGNQVGTGYFIFSITYLTT